MTIQQLRAAIANPYPKNSFADLEYSPRLYGEDEYNRIFYSATTQKDYAREVQSRLKYTENWKTKGNPIRNY